MKTIYKEGNQFILEIERFAKSNFEQAVTVIRSSGYTTTINGISDLWIKTQIKTIPAKERRFLPDPVIFQRGNMEPYESTDCNVLNLYFKTGADIQSAGKEFAEYCEKDLFRTVPKVAFVGHSKGGLFINSIAENLMTKTNILLISPTYGTIMGSERMVKENLELHLKNSGNKFWTRVKINGYKKLMGIIGSRRRVDYDMVENSDFLKNLKVESLSRHNSYLVVSTLPRRIINPIDKIFRDYGKCIGLDVRRSDGMVTVENQMKPEAFVKEVYRCSSTHAGAVKNSRKWIEKFIRESF